MMQRAEHPDRAPSASGLTLHGCTGDSVFYASQMVAVGETQAFVFQNQSGCDSVVTVEVSAYPVDYQQFELVSCPDEPIISLLLPLLHGLQALKCLNIPSTDVTLGP